MNSKEFDRFPLFVDLVFSWSGDRFPPIIVNDRDIKLRGKYISHKEIIINLLSLMFPLWGIILCLTLSVSYLCLKYFQPDKKYEFFIYGITLFSLFAGISGVRSIPVRIGIQKTYMKLLGRTKTTKILVNVLLLALLFLPVSITYCLLVEEKFRTLVIASNRGDFDYVNVIDLLKYFPERLETQLLAEQEIQSWLSLYQRDTLHSSMKVLLSEIKFLEEYSSGAFRSKLCLCEDSGVINNPKFWYSTVVQLSSDIDDPKSAKWAIELAAQAEEHSPTAELYKLYVELEYWEALANKLIENFESDLYFPLDYVIKKLKEQDPKYLIDYKKYISRRDETAIELSKKLKLSIKNPTIRKTHFYQEANDHLGQYFLSVCKERKKGESSTEYLRRSDFYFREVLETRSNQIHRRKDSFIWLRSPGKLGIYHLFRKINGNPFGDPRTKKWLSGLFDERCDGAEDMIRSIYNDYLIFQKGKQEDYKAWRDGSIRGDAARDRQKLLNTFLSKGWRF